MEFDAMSSTTDGESSASIRARVVKARDIQSRRFADNPEVHCNAQMTSAMLRKYCAIDSEGLAHLKEAMTQLNMSARAYDRILKVARTIADLDGSENIKPEHLAEAISYRNLGEVTEENDNHREESPASGLCLLAGDFWLRCGSPWIAHAKTVEPK